MSSPALLTEKFSPPLRILSKSALLLAWHNSRDSSSNPGARGVDGERAKTFAMRLDERCDRILRDVKKGNYQFQKLRSRAIPKLNSDKERLICIPTVRDRLVQRAMLNNLTTKLRTFEVSKYAQKGQGGTHKAIQGCKKFRANYSYAAKTDIIQFFDQISREKLKAKCRRLFRQSNLIPYLDQVIDTEIRKHNGRFTSKYSVQKGKGIRQGMPLSPFLANVALFELDKFITHHEIPAIRYVDDIVVFADTKQKCVEYLNLIEEQLLQVDLGLPPLGEGTKTKVYETNKPLDFLGVEIFWSDKTSAWEHRIPKEQLSKIREKIILLGDFDDLSQKKMSFFDFAGKVAGIEKGYVNAYKRAKNIDALRQLVREAQSIATKQILTELFGKDALESLDDKKLEFLRLNSIEVDAAF